MLSYEAKAGTEIFRACIRTQIYYSYKKDNEKNIGNIITESKEVKERME